MDIHDKDAVEAHLFDHIEKHSTGMLGLMGEPSQHFQPMTAFVDREANQIWFFTYRDADIAEAAGLDVTGGREAMFVVQDEHRLYACLGGLISRQDDRERIDTFWNDDVAAWYPDGKDDPRLTLLRLDLSSAEVWIHKTGPARFAWALTRRKAADHQPDISSHTRLTLH